MLCTLRLDYRINMYIKADSNYVLIVFPCAGMMLIVFPSTRPLKPGELAVILSLDRKCRNKVRERGLVHVSAS